MSAFHKDSVTSLENNNNNVPSGSKSSKSSRSRNNNSSNDKVHPCQYCKKSFVSPAKLRLHTAKFHAEERLNEVHPPPPPELSGGSLEAGPGGQDSVKLKFYEDGPGPRYHSPSSGSDGLPSQQVPEMELSYVNSSPEDISEFGGGKAAELPSMGGGSYSSIPTIHIPEFDNIQSKMGDNGEISNEAIQALLFSWSVKSVCEYFVRDKKLFLAALKAAYLVNYFDWGWKFKFEIYFYKKVKCWKKVKTNMITNESDRCETKL